MTTSEISRRVALAAGASAVGAVGLAACGTSSGGSSTAQGGGGSKSGTQVAKVSDIAVGKSISANADGKPVIVSRPTANTVACFSAICTHQGCTVAAQGNRAVCPCHGSIYNALTGAVIQPPAPAALATVAVTVKNGEIVTS
jgi:Rieske Fe-S protein